MCSSETDINQTESEIDGLPQKTQHQLSNNYKLELIQVFKPINDKVKAESCKHCFFDGIQTQLSGFSALSIGSINGLNELFFKVIDTAVVLIAINTILVYAINFVTAKVPIIIRGSVRSDGRVVCIQ